MAERSAYPADPELSFTASSPPTSSSSRPRTSSSQPSSSSSRSNLPLPPPAGRLPPPKGRSLHNASQKLRLPRRKDKRRLEEGEEEEWTLEDGDGGNMDGEMEELVGLGDSQVTEKPRKDEKESKGKRLVHKTSQLFSRKDKGRSDDNLSAPSTSRQTSFSSTASGDSSRSSPLATVKPPLAHQRQSLAISAPPKPKAQHSRRISQDSQTSWHGIPKTTRSGSSSTESAPDSARLPVPRRQSSNLSSSVPSLSRNLPQPSLAPSSMSTRMSSWFTHLISSSTSPETVAAASADPPSPARKSASAAASFLNAARQRAVDGVRQLLDTEAQPDKSTETIWLMGLPHPGHQPSSPSQSPSLPWPDLPEASERDSPSGRPSPSSKIDALRPAGWPKRKDSGPMSPPNKSLGQRFGGSALSLGSPGKQDSTPADSPGRRKPLAKDVALPKWPEACKSATTLEVPRSSVVYGDFKTRIWCTYRGQYAPILPMPTSLLIPSPEAYYSAFATTTNVPPSEHNLASKPSSWGWAKGPEERGLTSDAGWGCMLRTGQSLLANALINLHLGRDTKPFLDPSDPSSITEVEAYATYVRILSYFMDDPSPLCPFSVHRMALIGKELGKEVGEWFGPSTASGALKTLADAFPLCGLAVSAASDGIIYKSDVYAASSQPDGSWRTTEKGTASGKWGGKAVLILIGLRLGLDGVNPIYHESIKALFSFPQSVGIAGGRPNTSYYFVASQGNNLFYLDPHFTRPAVPLEVPPASLTDRRRASDLSSEIQATPTTMRLDTVDVDDVSDNSENSLSPSKDRPNRARQAKRLSKARSVPPPPSPLLPSSPSTPIPSSSSRPIDVFDAPAPPAEPHPDPDTFLDPQTGWYLNAYTETQLHTFHSDKVRKMPLSGLDPSMLLGFLVRNEADFEDFCRRTSGVSLSLLVGDCADPQLPQKIFSVQDEPLTWDEDDAGLESVSEPDLSDGDGSVPIPRGPEDEELLVDTTALTLADRGMPIEPTSKTGFGDDEWEARSSFPKSLAAVVDRSATPNSIPVLVEKPSMDMPKVAMPRIGTEHGVEAGDDEGLEAEGVDLMADIPGVGKGHGERRMMRQRTDSWVKPERPDDI